MTFKFALPTKALEPLENVRARFEHEIEHNDRLKWLLVSCLFVLYLALVLYLNRESAAAKIDYENARDQLTRVRVQTAEAGWPQRVIDAQSLRDQLEDRLWPGETPGLVEAGFERWIRQTLEGHGIEVRQVQLLRTPATEDVTERSRGSLASIQRIRAKVIGPLQEEAMLRFLNDAASNSYWVIVDQIIMRGGRNPRFEIDLATFFRTEGSN